MWIARISYRADNALFGSKTIRHKVMLTGYPISSVVRKRSVFATIAGLVFGEPRSKAAFLEDLKKDKRVAYVESKGDFVIAALVEPKWTAPFYDPFIIHIKPANISDSGEYIYEIGSWRREKLQHIISLLKEYRGAKLLRFSEEKISNITLLGLLPELTEKQRKALGFAIKNGYYNYPRKIELDKLAKLMGTSLSTYREHLRVAEKKVMPKLV
jgi:predicted DNA binding protein